MGSGAGSSSRDWFGVEPATRKSKTLTGLEESVKPGAADGGEGASGIGGSTISMCEL